jgi:LuxR family maltose regulon positive regulatory protein
MLEIRNIKPWLLRSKVSPPRKHVEAIPRPVLLEKLRTVPMGGLVMVQAPAGYGKSSLLAEWREVSLKQGDNFAWVSLDKEDDLESILAHLAFAFHLNGLELSHSELLQTNTQEKHLSSYALRILLQIIEETPCNFVVVLDDLETLSESTSSSFLESLLRWAPENLTVVLSGRQPPPIDLTDFAVRGLLTDIRKRDLRFNRDEIRAILGDYPEVTIKEIEQLTEGWPVFVRLVSLGVGLQALHTYPVDSNAFTHYLDANLLTLISKEQMRFLLGASIFGDIPVAFFTECYGDDYFRKILHNPYNLEDLISPIEGDIDTWRIHPLLREHLNDRLHKEFPEKVTESYQTVARWSAKQGNELMAVRVAAAIRDVELIEEILFDVGGPVTLWFKGLGYLRRINDLICSAPSCNSTPQGFPLIVLTDVITKAKLGHVDEAKLRFEDANKQGVFNITSDSSLEIREDQQLVEFSVAIARTTLDVYSFTPLNSNAIDILRSYGETRFAGLPYLQGLIWNADALLANEGSYLDRALESSKIAAIKFQTARSHFGEAHVTFHLAAANLALGRIRETSTLLDRARTIVQTHLPDDEELQIILLCLTGELQLQTTPMRLNETGQFQSKFLSKFKRLSFCLDFFLAGLLQLTDRYLLQNKPEAAQQFLCECDVIAHQRKATHVLRYIQFLRLITLIRSGHENDALTLFNHITDNDFKTQVVWREAEIHAEAVSLLAHRLNDVDIAVVDKQIRFAEQAGNQRMLMRLLAVECHRLMRSGNEMAAFSILVKLARLSGEIGFFREIAINAGNLLPLMSAYLKSKESNVPYHEIILANIKDLQNEAGSFEINGEKRHVTPAELRVLRELENGHSDKLIARSLTISPSTVHFHLKNIYRKLGATSRSHAIRLAKQAYII